MSTWDDLTAIAGRARYRRRRHPRLATLAAHFDCDDHLRPVLAAGVRHQRDPEIDIAETLADLMVAAMVRVADTAGPMDAETRAAAQQIDETPQRDLWVCLITIAQKIDGQHFAKPLPLVEQAAMADRTRSAPATVGVLAVAVAAAARTRTVGALARVLAARATMTTP